MPIKPTKPPGRKTRISVVVKPPAIERKADFLAKRADTSIVLMPPVINFKGE